MTAAQKAQQETTARPGWVTRTYPAVLERWPFATQTARLAAIIVFSECEPGKCFTFSHRKFFRRLCVNTEASSREAFQCLEDHGLMARVYTKKGTGGYVIWRVADPIAVHHRRGLGIFQPDPQLLLPIMAEEIVEFQELSDGITRVITIENACQGTLSTPSECVPGHAFPPTATDNACHSTHSQSGHEPGECFFGSPTGDELDHATEADESTSRDGEAGRNQTTQSNSRQGIEAGRPATVRDASRMGSAPDEQLSSPPPPRAPVAAGGRSSAGVGTRDATRVDLSQEAQERLSPSNLNSINQVNSAVPTARASRRTTVTPDGALQTTWVAREASGGSDAPGVPASGTAADLNGWVSTVDEFAVRRAESKVRELERAVRQAEAKARTAADGLLRQYVLDDWTQLLATHVLSHQHVDELIGDLAKIENWRNAPGALVNARLRELYAAATGKHWRAPRNPR